MLSNGLLARAFIEIKAGLKIFLGGVAMGFYAIIDLIMLIILFEIIKYIKKK